MDHDLVGNFEVHSVKHEKWSGHGLDTDAAFYVIKSEDQCLCVPFAVPGSHSLPCLGKSLNTNKSHSHQ